MYNEAQQDDVLDDEREMQSLTSNTPKQRKPPGNNRRYRQITGIIRQHQGLIACCVSAVFVMMLMFGGAIHIKVEVNSGSSSNVVKKDAAAVEDVPAPAPAVGTLNPVAKATPAPVKNEGPQSPAPTQDFGEWGFWKFYDGAKEDRPKNDYCGEADPIHRDIDPNDFPENAWQTDAVYVNHFLDEGLKLVSRVRDAIYAEYGLSDKEAQDAMFKLTINDCDAGEMQLISSSQGGWICKRSFDGLSRRLLHAMMTNDEFNIVLGGHSAAAGHGNHLLQSYVLQIGVVLRPVFEKLGMKLRTMNASHGGLGTLQSVLGAKGVYGEKIDFLIWDSSMTENYDPHIDIFHRLGLLTERAPYIHTAVYRGDLMRTYNQYGGDVGGFGKANMGAFPVTHDEEQAKQIPWAARYVNSEDSNLFKQNKYRSECWIEREDFTPNNQQPFVGGRAGWHPGFREHQVVGRGISLMILHALENAMTQWLEICVHSGYPLEKEHWHMTEYYKKIHEKIKAETDSPCFEAMKDVVPRACSVSLNARTEFTPRHDPENSSIRSILKALPDGSKIDFNNGKGEKLAYEGPDLRIPSVHVPEGEIDVEKIAGFTNQKRVLSSSQVTNTTTSRSLENIVPGSLWDVQSWIGHCDGTEKSYTCNRQVGNPCFLSGHNDYRGQIVGDEYSGWLVMNLKDVKEGIIVLKFHAWINVKVCGQCVNTLTRGMDGRNLRVQSLSREKHSESSNLEYDNIERQLKVDPDTVIPDTFLFDFAINGKITTWNKDEFLKRRVKIQRVVELFTIMDDPSWKSGDVELAIRTRGAGRVQDLALTHVYWA